MERPRLRQLEDTENDLQEVKLKRWRQKANNREKRLLQKEAEPLTGPWSQGVSEMSEVCHKGGQLVPWS
jgi:hypothetical protein